MTAGEDLAAPNAELLRSLGRLVRGLSALFWGLPLALLICFYTVKAGPMFSLRGLSPLLCTGFLLYGLFQLGAFQKQERVWRHALERAVVLGFVNFGLSPFLYWYSRVPGNRFFLVMTCLLLVFGLLFLGSLNFVLRRLGAMLPDETLRSETRQFTALNVNLVLAMLVFGSIYVLLRLVPPASLPEWAQILAGVVDRASLFMLVPFVLLPLAMTMAMLWKTKQVILESVFSAPHGQ